MFIYVNYRDPPELSSKQRESTDYDEIVEKQLLVNPNCYVRVMLEYIRKKCKLAQHTYFDLCDEGGALKDLFNKETYSYANELFVHKKIYFLIVLKLEKDNWNVLPQVNPENPMYLVLQTKVKKYILTGSASATDVSRSPGKSPAKPKKK